MAEGRPIYRMLSPLFWDDPGVQQLDAHNQLIAAHILTSRQTNGAGLFRFSLAEAEETLAKVSGTFPIRFAKVCDTLNWRYHEPSKTLYLPTWWKWNPPDNPKHLIGAMKCLYNVPQTPLLQEFASNTTWLAPNLHDTFRIRIGNVSARYPIQEQEHETEQEHEPDHEPEQKPEQETPGVVTDEIAFPSQLDTEAFRTGWLEWEAYKLEQFKFVFKPTGRKAAFTQAIKRGPSATLELIQQSMANGWKGLIEKDGVGSTEQPHVPGPSAESSPEVQAVFAERDRKRAENEPNSRELE